LQETIKKNNIQYLIVGIGLNLVSSPKINQYPTTSLYDLTNSKISINKISKELKDMYKNFLKSQVSFQ
jgi:BirA family biotin operon repressor/biotin-[acetyl-CoA-carboxylase] ligase